LEWRPHRDAELLPIHAKVTASLLRRNREFRLDSAAHHQLVEIVRQLARSGTPPRSAPGSVGLIERGHFARLGRTRIPELMPIRYGGVLQSPFTNG